MSSDEVLNIAPLNMIPCSFHEEETFDKIPIRRSHLAVTGNTSESSPNPRTRKDKYVIQEEITLMVDKA